MGFRDLSLEEKVGQVFMLGFPAKDPTGAATALRDLKAGGLIYFGRNVGTARETAALSADLQDMALGVTGIPLLISADQEGGIVSRLIRDLPGMPGPMSLGAAGDPALALEVSRAIGIQLRAAGINMDLAPVLDVNDNPRNPVIGVRSFGSDPGKVSELGRAAVRGFMSAGVAPVGKHFPGHGNTSVDSHLDLPVLPHPMDRLEQVELAPFRAAIAEGLPAIMTAHIVFNAVDPSNPATMSSAVLQGLLRGKMGFKGLLMTDCLEMQAVARSPGTARAAVLAFAAGVDLLLISHTERLQEQAYRALLDAVQSGEVPESRLDEAIGRILSLKEAMGIPNPLPPEEAGSDARIETSRRAHLRSITVLRADRSSFPLRTAGEALVVAAAVEPRTPGGAVGTGAGTAAAGALARCLSRLGGLSAREVTAEEFLSGDRHGQAVIVTQNAWKDPQQASLAQRLLDAAPDALVVAVRDPYDANVLPSARTLLCSYSPRPEAMDAVAAVLAGAHKATGRLPVTLT